MYNVSTSVVIRLYWGLMSIGPLDIISQYVRITTDALYQYVRITTHALYQYIALEIFLNF
jgi:hypothetical protein